MSSRATAKLRIADRQTTRYPHLRQLSINYEGATQEIPLRPPDISTRGMFINTTQEYPEGAILKVRFRLARTNLEVQVRCEVRYCLPGVGIGVEYVDISPQSRRAIEQELLLT